MSKHINPDHLDRKFYTHWANDRVRYGDLDPVGHANNAAYSTYFETGRFALLQDIKIGKSHIHDTAIVQLNISFIKELTIGTDIHIGVKVGRIGQSSLQIFSAIFVDGECHAYSEAICVVFDKEKRKATQIPDDLREKLTKFQ